MAKKRKSQKLLKAEEEHARFLERMGIKGKRNKSPLPLMVAPWRGGPSAPAEGAPGSRPLTGDPCYKKDKLTDWKWKRGAEEAPATVDAMTIKANSIAPLYNKGPYQLVTAKDDVAAGRRRG